MGGLVLKVNDLDVSETANSVSFPYAANCEYLNVFVGPTGNPTRNLIYGKPQADVVGVPVAMGNSIKLKSLVNYIQTHVAAGANMSMIAIVKSVDVPYLLISNYGGPRTDAGTGTNTNGASLALPSSLSGRQIVFTRPTAGGADVLNQTTPVALTGLGVPKILASRFGTAINGASVYNRTDVLIGTIGFPANSTPALGSPLRIGSGYSNPYASTTEIELYGAAIWSTTLGESDLFAACDWFKAYFATRGVTGL